MLQKCGLFRYRQPFGVTQLALAPYSQSIGHPLPTTRLETPDSELSHFHELTIVSPPRSFLYNPRPGLQSAKPSASVPRKLAIATAFLTVSIVLIQPGLVKWRELD
jgi:hypothetical protein